MLLSLDAELGDHANRDWRCIQEAMRRGNEGKSWTEIRRKLGPDRNVDGWTDGLAYWPGEAWDVELRPHGRRRTWTTVATEFGVSKSLGSVRVQWGVAEIIMNWITFILLCNSKGGHFTK